VQESGLNSVVFAGMCVGAPVWGMVSDAYGRKTSFGLATLISAVFGFATAAAPNFEVRSAQQPAQLQTHLQGQLREERRGSTPGVATLKLHSQSMAVMGDYKQTVPSAATTAV